MVQILPQEKNIGSSIGQQLGFGLSRGIESGLEKYQKDQANQAILDIISKAYPGANPSAQQNAQKEPGSPEIAQTPSGGPNLTPEQILAIGVKNPQIAKLLQDQSTQAQNLEQKKKEFGFKEKKLLLDETKDYRKTIQNQAQSAEELSPVLDQMENLIKTGKLTNPLIAKFAEKAGLIGLLDPTSQQYQGLAVGFLKDAKNIFGSRVTNFDLQTYIDKIPRLTQTDGGKKVLIDNFRTLGEASKVRNRIKNQIIRENGGYPPLDLQERVEEKSAPLLDKLSEKFNKNIYKASAGSPGKILMRSSSGELGEVPEEKVKEALSKGYTLG